jgi:hypothetical protein
MVANNERTQTGMFHVEHLLMASFLCDARHMEIVSPGFKIL